MARQSVAAQLRRELEKVKAENEAMRNRSLQGINLRVSAKGAVSVYGLQRFPVTLYAEQWQKLLEMADDIRGFIAENASKLARRETK